MIIENKKPLQEPTSNTPATGMTGNGYYEIIIKGYIDKQRGVFFKPMKIQHLLSGETSIAGYVKDQTELYSILTFIRDMGIPLIRVEQRQSIPE